mmetsp:Transcript_42260/g.120496  ORF Transcript_42260/g.120496 Transcript_42260/m.120496 type:complete len:287 (+) Transcript_42260:322-1182(+)
MPKVRAGAALGLRVHVLQFRAQELLDMVETLQPLQQLLQPPLRGLGGHASQLLLREEGAQPPFNRLQAAHEILLALADVVLHEDGVHILLRAAESNACVEKLLERRAALLVQAHDDMSCALRDVQIDAEGGHDLASPRLPQQGPDLLARDLVVAVQVRAVEERPQRGAELVRLRGERGQLVLLLARGEDDALHDDADHEVHEGKVREHDQADKVQRPEVAVPHGRQGDVRPALERHDAEVREERLAQRAKVRVDVGVGLLAGAEQQHREDGASVDDEEQQQRHPSH